jgi:hypothetical protein
MYKAKVTVMLRTHRAQNIAAGDFCCARQIVSPYHPVPGLSHATTFLLPIPR